ncbi:hypothetical protein K7I13_06650 [Brucepastera parasyntrophica]|nr:hypothetical protein [Brucepastera parasyntrophica]ULQ60931.1 hypothetical protein K7I13_06650 [Brucepastera parasyntrophica]
MNEWTEIQKALFLLPVGVGFVFGVQVIFYAVIKIFIFFGKKSKKDPS